MHPADRQKLLHYVNQGEYFLTFIKAAADSDNKKEKEKARGILSKENLGKILLPLLGAAVAVGVLKGPELLKYLSTSSGPTNPEDLLPPSDGWGSELTAAGLGGLAGFGTGAAAPGIVGRGLKGLGGLLEGLGTKIQGQPAEGQVPAGRLEAVKSFLGKNIGAGGKWVGEQGANLATTPGLKGRAIAGGLTSVPAALAALGAEELLFG